MSFEGWGGRGGGGRGAEGFLHDGGIQPTLCKSVAQVHREQLQVGLIHRLKVGVSQLVHRLQVMAYAFLQADRVKKFGSHKGEEIVDQNHSTIVYSGMTCLMEMLALKQTAQRGLAVESSSPFINRGLGGECACERRA